MPYDYDCDVMSPTPLRASRKVPMTSSLTLTAPNLSIVKRVIQGLHDRDHGEIGCRSSLVVSRPQSHLE